MYFWWSILIDHVDVCTNIQLSVIFLHISFFFFFSVFFFPVMLYYSYTLMFSLFYSIVAMLLCVVLFAP